MVERDETDWRASMRLSAVVSSCPLIVRQACRDRPIPTKRHLRITEEHYQLAI
jgi:uncharacterized protein YcgI (DUF1989 family)